MLGTIKGHILNLRSQRPRAASLLPIDSNGGQKFEIVTHSWYFTGIANSRFFVNRAHSIIYITKCDFNEVQSTQRHVSLAKATT